MPPPDLRERGQPLFCPPGHLLKVLLRPKLSGEVRIVYGGRYARYCGKIRLLSFLLSMRILSKGILFISTDNVIHMTCKYLSQLELDGI